MLWGLVDQEWAVNLRAEEDNSIKQIEFVKSKDFEIQGKYRIYHFGKTNVITWINNCSHLALWSLTIIMSMVSLYETDTTDLIIYLQMSEIKNYLQ